MGKLILKDVEFEIDVREGRDARRKFDIEGESLADLKNTINSFGNEIMAEFGVNADDVKVKGAGFSQNRFVVF